MGPVPDLLGMSGVSSGTFVQAPPGVWDWLIALVRGGWWQLIAQTTPRCYRSEANHAFKPPPLLQLPGI
ncbi:MAG: hypothetical protein KF791_14040 [Verrucomicrobiae bacterium]|nr:hypothetical protein [Verrucomicrobiae bacterium]